MAEARIDKWLWASRIFKTRTIAAEACKKGRVSINGTQVKPSRMIKPGEVIYKPQNKMFHFCKTFCSKITLVNTIQNVILNPI